MHTLVELITNEKVFLFLRGLQRKVCFVYIRSNLIMTNICFNYSNTIHVVLGKGVSHINCLNKLWFTQILWGLFTLASRIVSSAGPGLGHWYLFLTSPLQLGSLSFCCITSWNDKWFHISERHSSASASSFLTTQPSSLISVKIISCQRVEGTLLLPISAVVWLQLWMSCTSRCKFDQDLVKRCSCLHCKYSRDRAVKKSLIMLNYPFMLCSGWWLV